MTQVRPLGTLRYAVGACDHWLAKTLVPVAEGLGVRVFPGPVGKDRADSELLRRAERDLPPSVDVVVIGSGDGAFARLAEAQRGLGRRVVVVGREGHISRRLRVVADEVVNLGTAHWSNSYEHAASDRARAFIVDFDTLSSRAAS
jgi:hypothetical protein